MASIFAFRSRSPDRDRRTDEDRVQRIHVLLSQIGTEIEAERAGLSKRLQAQTVDAGFLSEAIENGEDSKRNESRLDYLSSSLRNAEVRLAVLEKQSSVVLSLKKNLGALLD